MVLLCLMICRRGSGSMIDCKLRVLIACERSQVEQQAFAALGHFACSLDILPCYGPDPDRHIVADAYAFPLSGWDLIVAHPPCTDLTHANNGKRNLPGRVGPVVRALRLWARFLFEAPCPVAVENPVGIPNEILPPTQIIQPYLFGDPFVKRTCLWLRGLPPLMSTLECVRRRHWVGSHNRRGCAVEVCGVPSNLRSQARSQSFPGVAAAMAMQWSSFVLSRRGASSNGVPVADARGGKNR